MIPEILFDTEDFDSIFEDARGKIAGLYPEWTDYNYHDPGITMLEMFAWLKEGQQFYMDQTGEEQKEKFLKLLGTKRLRKEPASSLLAVDVDEDGVIPKGTKFYADQICYETMEQNYVVKEDIIKCFYADTKMRNFVDGHQLSFGSPLRIQMFGSEPKALDAFYIGLEDMLPEQIELSIYFDLFTEYEVKRTTLTKELTVPFVHFVMEYFTEDGWEGVSEQKDSTYGFLQDGQIFFQLNKSMKKSVVFGEEAYYLRIRILDGAYDVAPVLESFSINVFEVRQIDSQVEHCVAKKVHCLEDGAIEVEGKTFLSVYGENDIYIEQDGILHEIAVVEKYLRQDKGMCTFRFYPPQDIEPEGRIHIISFADDATRFRTLSIANEYPSQKYALSDEYVLYENFSLMVKEEDGYVIWEKVEDFSGSGPEDRHFIFDSREGTVQFGDGRHGMPPAGEIRLISYAKCLGTSGKVKDNQIREIAEELGIVAEATNQKSSWGGRDEETFEESFARVQKEMIQPLTAVSYEDYEQYIKKTPGLMIASCKALLPQEVKEIFPYYNDSAVTVVVKPFVKQLKKEVMKIYRKNILAYIEQFRMAGTSVYLVKPEYIHFDVYVDVGLESYYVGGEERVKEAIESFFQEFSYKFGSCVRYSGLYGKLDMLECVRQLNGLSFEVKGTGVKYLSDGSVLAPPNGVVELGQIDCQYSMI